MPPSPAAAAAALEYLSPDNAAQRLAIAQWKDNLLNWYYAIIGAAFIAREIRNLIERRRKRLVSMSYPGRIVRVPRGWSVLEASRSFHLPHAAMCGGRARCSTCRVRVTAGEEFCPPAANDEQGDAEPHRRAAGRAAGVPVAPAGRYLGRAAGADRAAGLSADGPQRGGEREVVVLFCDFRNRAELPPIICRRTCCMC